MNKGPLNKLYFFDKLENRSKTGEESLLRGCKTPEINLAKW